MRAPRQKRVQVLIDVGLEKRLARHESLGHRPDGVLDARAAARRLGGLEMVKYLMEGCGCRRRLSKAHVRLM